MENVQLQDAPRRSILSFGRLRRLGFALASLCSVLLCVGLAVGWWRSHKIMDLISLEKGPYTIELATPTDGLMLLFQNDSLPGSPSFSSSASSSISHVLHSPTHFSSESINYPPTTFRDDPAEWCIGARYHPFYYGNAISGKFNRFVEQSDSADGVHETSFGWGFVIPMWFILPLSSILPAIWIIVRFVFRSCVGPGSPRHGGQSAR